jgi:alpha-glucosidase
MKFWFDRGVDGFRLDVLWHVIKSADFRDNPLNPDYRPEMGEMHKVLQLNSTDQPEAIDVAREMRALSDRYDARVLIGEIYLPFEKLVKYYGPSLDGVHLPFNFTLIEAAWRADVVHDLIERYERALPEGAWPNWVLGNHDRPRIASRTSLAQARVAAVLLLTLRGTPTMYYGDELGLQDVAVPADRVVDPRELREPGKGLGRDPVRSPMPWTPDARGAGFTTGTPWLPLNADVKTRNVESEMADDDSLLNFYRLLLAVRRTHPALTLGSIALEPLQGDVLIYRREYANETMRVALNFSDREAVIELPDADRPILSTHGSAPPTTDNTVTLRPNEALLL